MSVVSASTARASRSSTIATAPRATRATRLPRPQVRQLIRDLLEEIADDEDETWGGGSISASAYEAAWVALVREPGDAGRLAFPRALDWLLAHQRADGGWDPPFPRSLVPSMAALLALHRAPGRTPRILAAAERGERFLRRALRRWRADLLDTPFFEFLVPLLAEELARDGVRLRIPDLDVMGRRRAAKLRQLPLEALYGGTSSLLHALEVFGPDLDYGRLRAQRAPNGCYGYSPSATAAVLLYAPEWDVAAAGWLRRLTDSGGTTAGSAAGALPTSHPADVFEAAWALHLLHHAGYPLDPAGSPAVRRMLLWLRSSLTDEGARFARMRALPCDADDTALALTALNWLGVQADPSPLWPFERDDQFVSYDGERTASVSTNAHVLEALLSVDAIGLPALAARREKVARYVLAERTQDGSWTDKWHLSPYYGTLSSVLALARMPDSAVQAALVPSLGWLERTQRRGGGWGMRTATIEETAYGVLTVTAIARVLPRLRTAANRRMIRRAEGFLQRHLAELGHPASLPALWVDKTLYMPGRVVRAAALAALYACQHGEWATDD